MNKTELQQVMDALQSVCNRPDTAESYDAMMAGVQAAIALCEASQARLTDGDLLEVGHIIQRERRSLIASRASIAVYGRAGVITADMVQV